MQSGMKTNVHLTSGLPEISTQGCIPALICSTIYIQREVGHGQRGEILVCNL